ncbi:hypothetical protein JCM3765_002060 [Sporobolomyces pararoseus]
MNEPPTTTTTRRGGGGGGIKFEPPKSNQLFSTQQEYDTAQELERSSNQWHHLPLLLVALPPLLSIVHGRAENWSDAILLLLVAFYLYQLVKVPWEMYYASTTRTVLPSSTPEEEEDPSTLLLEQRNRSISILRRNELISLLSTFLVPFLGSYLLHYVKRLLSDPDRYVNDSLINMFMIATSVKPFLHLISLLKNHSLYHQEQVHYPSTKIHSLELRLTKLESDLLQLSRAFATKSDVRALRDGVDIPLTQLSKAVKKFNRKEEFFRLSSEEKFGILENKIQELVEVGIKQQEVLETLKQENERFRAQRRGGGNSLEFANFLGRLLGSITSTSSYESSNNQVQNGNKRQKKKVKEIGWYEKGLNWWLFWPLNVPKSAIGWVVDKTGKTVKGIEEGFIDEKEELRGIANSTGSAARKGAARYSNTSTTTRKKMTTNALKA